MDEAARPHAALKHLLDLAGLPAGEVAFTGADPVLRSRYRLGAAGAAALGAVGLAADALWSLRHPRQDVSVDTTEAVASLRGHQYLLLDGKPPPHVRDGLSGFYPAGDGRHVYLHCNFPNLRARNLAVLGAGETRESVAAAVARWQGEALETAIHEGGGCASFVRTPAEWEAHPHNAAVAALPVLEIEQVGDAPRQPLPDGARPLAGIRALDLTRVIAGPSACRILAEHGAELLKIARPDLPGSGSLDLDTGIGKRSAFLDLRKPEEAERLRELVRTGDVFVQSYRPGTLAARGFGPEALAALRPGLVQATLSAWGRSGPWRLRRGYDTIVQSATGIAHVTGGEGSPALLPCAAIDYISGNLLAFGVMVALHRRATIGGSWLVRVSLAGVGHWMRSQGMLDADAAASVTGDAPDVAAAGMGAEIAAPMGLVHYLRSPIRLSATPPRLDRPPVPLGHDAPEWLRHA
ncbi:MAG TPA: CoA transferase [Roseomonas sp.]|jgi:crotonobetainyl-CoA:carnitine CoA-transferase CaiB-like acyl-CoA transferase